MDPSSPDFGRYIVEASFADVYGRAGLTLGALYAGHPRSVNGLRIAGEVFAERGLDPLAQPDLAD